MTQPAIFEMKAKGEEIEAIITQRLIPNLADLEKHKVLLALLSFYIVLVRPDLTGEEMADVVKQSSQYICLMLSGTTEPVKKKEMN